MEAIVFPGQGAQYVGMGQDLYEKSNEAKAMFESANQVLGFDITKLMFEGTEEDLKQTKVTQPAIFLHSTILAKHLPKLKPEMVAGHSLGEFSALVAAQVLPFEDALLLVYKRAMAMQKACEIRPSTMAVILGLEDTIVEEVCNNITDIVVPANYNCPGQLVISGTQEGITEACKILSEKGAKRAMPLKVGGAFHSPLMEPAQEELAKEIKATAFKNASCPIYQNFDAQPHTDASEIKQRLIAQLTGAVRWTQTLNNMITDGATSFTEIGPGKALQGMIKKVDRKMPTMGFDKLEE